ncbi:hypothetical protein [Streptomyces sp. NWU339]|uniref:hypothetical protein n=1 Tax=Streptomyces sp. NWU339 TaxID=2185284 RepID=UPI0011B54E50|nr:hypothetical protein [Streptomyces sp. NWU339]
MPRGSTTAPRVGGTGPAAAWCTTAIAVYSEIKTVQIFDLKCLWLGSLNHPRCGSSCRASPARPGRWTGRW